MKPTFFRSQTRKAIIPLTIVALCLSPLTAQDDTGGENQRPDLSRDEVNTAAPVRFINRSNRPASNELREREVNEGRGLAETVIGEGEGSAGGITVRRIFSRDAEGFGADLVSLDENVDFGHVNRIKRYLQGYLMRAFEYDAEDAEVLSRFILYYNARHRGEMDKVKGKYSEPVVSAVDPEKIGIDVRYSNWAGRTQLLLPLRPSVVREGGTDVDTGEIDENTEDVDEGERDELQDVTDDRREQDAEDLQDAQEENEQANIDNQREQEDVQQQREEIERRIEELNEDPEGNAEEIEQAQEELEQVEEEQQQLEEEAEQITEESEQIEEDIAANEEATDESQNQENQDVAANTETGDDTGANTTTDTEDTANTDTQTEQDEAQDENVIQDKIFFMRVLRYETGGHYNNELWAIDAAAGDALLRSPYTNICGRDFLPIESENIIVVIGYTGSSHTDDHHLVSLSAEDLTKQNQSAESIHWRSPMEFRNGKIYAFEKKDGQFYLTRFNPGDLSMEARSSIAVSPNSSMTFHRGKVYLTGIPGEGQPTEIHIFQEDDLSHLNTIDSNRLDQLSR